MKTNKILMAGALALSMVLSGGMLSGCSNSSTKDTKTTEVVKKKEVKTLGKKTKDSKSLKFTNITGKRLLYSKQNQVLKKVSVITCWTMEML